VLPRNAGTTAGDEHELPADEERHRQEVKPAHDLPGHGRDADDRRTQVAATAITARAEQDGQGSDTFG
jgi:hypothetical protein